MKIIYENELTEDELDPFREIIYHDVVSSAKVLITAMRHFELEPAERKNQEYSDFLTEFQVDPDTDTHLDPKVGDAISSLWNDPNIPKVMEHMEHRTEFYLSDSAS